MKRWRNISQRSTCSTLRCPDVCVTLQTDKPDFMPCQHPRIGRAVWLMASLAALESHGRVLERKRSPLVGMAAKAARLVGCECLQQTRVRCPVRIVAIDAGHRALREAVRMRLSKLAPGACMACRALLVYLTRLARDHSIRAITVDGMACCAIHLTSRMAPENAAGVHILIKVASQACDICLDTAKALRIHDILGRCGFGVLASRSVTGLARLPLPPTPGTDLYRMMRVLFKCFEDIFVTRLARFRTHVRRRSLRRGFQFLRSRQNGERQENRRRKQARNRRAINTEHGLWEPRTQTSCYGIRCSFRPKDSF